MDFHRGMDPARRRAADQQRNVETLALHLGGDMRHLVERGRDQAGEADGVDLLARARRARIFAAGAITPRSMIS